MRALATVPSDDAPPSPVPADGGPSAGSIPELVESARAGDTAAFESLYRTHVGRVHAVCLRMLVDAHEAEDATQEAFVRAWERLSGFEGRSAFSTWLHRLAVNVVLDRIRARKRRPDLTGEEETLERLPDRRPGTVTAGTGIDLERAIAELPPGARTAFVLHDVEGYRHREIAEMTGTAEGTWKAQLHRARKLLREAMNR